jgi:hypothetical protein
MSRRRDLSTGIADALFRDMKRQIADKLRK